MSDVKTTTLPATAYDADFYAWTQDQAARLRDLRPNALDWGNLAEEIESLGRSQKKLIRNHLVVLLAHLLKWAHQPDKRTNSWRGSIQGARDEIADELRDSPSLKRYPGQELARQYRLALLHASGETELPIDVFPETCPFTIDQVLDPDFWPEPESE